MGDGTFMDMAASWGIDIGIYSMSSSFGDFDKDLDWDIMVSNGANDGNHFLVCQGAPFQVESDSLSYTDMAEEAGVLLENLAWGAMWLDVNNDSWEDLYIATGTSMYTDYPNVTNFFPNSTNGLFLNPGGTLPLEDISGAINWENELTFSVALETTTKTRLDFISHRMGPRAALYNGVVNDNHWLQVMLVPDGGHPDAIGSVDPLERGNAVVTDLDVWFPIHVPKQPMDALWVGKQHHGGQLGGFMGWRWQHEPFLRRG